MGYRIVSHIGTTVGMRQRRPRVERSGHLAFIRTLPCVICGLPGSDPAHLRAGNLALNKPHAGVAEKPDDKWTIPLCRGHHDEQHSMNELSFWSRYGIKDPFLLCLVLHSVSGDTQEAELILGRWQRPAERRVR